MGHASASFSTDLPRWRVAWWFAWRSLCWLWMWTWYRSRYWGGHHIPTRGPVLLVSNHQSFLDPMLIGMGCNRRPFFSLARATLFDYPLFGRLIRSLIAIPVHQGKGAKRAMQHCIEVLRAGHTLMVFPEGSRTDDGQTQPFNPGTMLLIKRGRPRVVPVAIEGAYEAWPRGRAPRLTGRAFVQYGRPVDAQTLIDMGRDEALGYLFDRVESMRQELSRRLAGSNS